MIEQIAPEPIDADADTGPPLGAAAVLLVAAGGTVGTSLRYVLSRTIPAAGGIPTGIFIANLSGAALLGLLIQVLATSGADVGRRRTARLVLGVGVLGGYTTYSAVATDTADLIIEGRAYVGIGYALATVLLGAAATWSGVLLGHAWRDRR